jgi:photosystem II stability/assembly factor-like uncharacterized protein
MKALHLKAAWRGHAALLALLLLAGGVCAAADTASPAPSMWRDPADLPAEPMPLTSRSLVLGLASVGNTAVAVGERGAILLSTDRKTWTQVADVPTRATLTAVAAFGNRVWAVGHDGVILTSGDAGQHWIVQRRDPWQAPAAGAPAPDPRQGAPLLDVLFTDENTGYAVGAYSQLLTTRDGGLNWTSQKVASGATAAGGKGDELVADKGGTFSKEQLAIGDETDPHFNSITRTGDGSLFIAGERGAAFRSRDQGKTWQPVKWPYNGSMFGVLGFEGQHILAFGLRGHAFESDDLGEHWSEVKTGTELSLLGGMSLSGGGAVLVGANGLVLLRRNATDAFRSGVMEPAGVLSAVLPAEAGATFTVAGENGIGRYQPKQ